MQFMNYIRGIFYGAPLPTFFAGRYKRVPKRIYFDWLIIEKFCFR